MFQTISHSNAAGNGCRKGSFVETPPGLVHPFCILPPVFLRSGRKNLEVIKMSQKKNLPYVSDHTLNKADPEAIVYRDADGNLIRLTEADFASREEYEKWKAWSDEDYAEIEKGDRQYYAHKRPLFDQDCPTPSVEEVFFGRSERRQRESEEEKIVAAFLKQLTPIQRRRFIMYFGQRMTLKEIARIEGVGFPRIEESIDQCRKKASIFICKLSVNEGVKMRDFFVLGERGQNPPQNLEN
jgi:hypothetical protein